MITIIKRASRSVHNETWSAVKKKRIRSKRRRAIVESLEQRHLLAAITVNSPLDNAIVGDGLVTLREAIYAANTDSTTDLGETATGQDDISFSPSIFSNGSLTISLDISLPSLEITEAVRVFGSSTGQVTIDGGGVVGPLFSISDANSSSQFPVRFEDLTLTGAGGEAIFNRESLTIVDSTIRDNLIPAGGGSFPGGSFPGGLVNLGTAELIRSRVSNNEASGVGGGIYNTGTLTLDSSTVDGNRTPAGGGGIFNAGTGVLTILSSTISGNTSTNNAGGGILNSTNGTLTIDSSTISGNRSSGDGTGVLNAGQGAISHSTITGNTSYSSGRSGVYSPGTTLLAHTIVAGNTSGAPTGPAAYFNDLGGSIDSSSSNNLIGDPSSSGGLTHGTNNNQIGDGLGGTLDISTVLSPLANNGGATFTHALVAGSPAINAGDPSFLPPPSADQRGGMYQRVVGGVVDIGALEDAAVGEPALDIRILGDGEVVEGDSGTTAVEFLVSRSGNGTDVSVDLVLGGVIDSSDATLASSTISFVTGGAESQVVTVLINGDETLEDDEVFSVELFQPTGATLSTLSQATATILNDEGNLIVTTLVDENDGNLGIGTGDSLREVLEFANNSQGLDVIGFSPALFSGDSLTLSLDPTLTPLQVADEVRIFGSDSGQVTIDGSNAIPIFTIDDFDSAGEILVRLEDLTLSGALGESILNRESLELVNSTIRDNQALTGATSPVGGIINFGTAHVIGSLIADNHSNGSAGGIYNRGTLTLESSTVRDNESVFAGGGIFNVNGGFLSVIDSTITGNSSTNSGGGILNSVSSTLVIRSSTISGNRTDGGEGSGVFNGGQATIANSTITGNASNILGRAGLYSGGTTLLSHTIVAGNGSGGQSDSMPTSPSNDLEGIVDPLSDYNLIGDPNTSGGLTDGTNGNIVGDGFGGLLDIDAVLNPLANNGGPTFTHALVAGSPAIDAGDLGFVGSATDQRGGMYQREINNRVDVGAFEFGAVGEPSLDIQQLGDGEIVEGDSGTTAVSFIVSRSGTSTDVSVDLTLGGAIDASDASLSTTSLSFVAGGDESKIVTVLINGDETLERDEVFAVELLQPIGATLSTQAQATTTILNDEGNLIVTTLADENDGNLGIGTGDSLREVLEFANNSQGLDVIGFSPSLFTSGSLTVSLDPTSVPLQVTDDVRIFGSDSAQVTIDGSNAIPIFTIDDFDSNSRRSVRLQDLTLSGASGEAIFNREILVLVDSVVRDNLIPVGAGPTLNGGIVNAGTADLIGSLIADNESSGGGGGIYNRGNMTLVSSTVRGNKSAFAGGGILNGSGGNLSVIASTINDNMSTGNAGGGILNSASSTLFVESSTISGNRTSGGEGSGVLNAGQAMITDSTITGNTSLASGRAGLTSTGTTLLSHTIVAGNLGGADSGPTPPSNDLEGNIDPLSDYNLIGDPNTSGGLTDGTNGNIVGDGFGGLLGIDTVLAPLANNGGPTFTHALVAGSPAIDAGDVGFVGSATDQRGGMYQREINNRVDVGAFEFGAVGEPSLDIQQLGDGEIVEGDSGTTAVSFIVSRSGTSTDVSVDLTLGGAIDASDASLSTTSLSFVAGGDESKMVTVLINGDETFEGDEVFAVELLQPTGATLSTQSQATTTILNDEGNLIVTTLADENDGNLGIGTGDSLREVLEFANNSQGLDVIGFSPTLFSGGSLTLSLDPTSVPLQVTDDVRIFGSDSAQVTIDGSNAIPIFTIDDFDSDSRSSVHLEDLTLSGASGEAILNHETLVLVDSVVRDNSFPDGAGPTRNGGIVNFGTADLIGSLIADNESSGVAGGIYNRGIMTLVSSTVRGNESFFGGGGIFNANGGTLSVIASTISDNASTTSAGGGILNANTATLFIDSSTITGNRTRGGEGSGVLNAGLAEIAGSTITGNSSRATGRAGLTSTGTTLLSHSIVAGNLSGIASGPSGQPNNLEGTFDPLSEFNLIGNRNTSGGLTDGVNGNIVGDVQGAPLDIEAVLAPLAANGGPTLTHALVPGSPAIDAGDVNFAVPSIGPVTDQRGGMYQRVIGGRVDIGSFEFDAVGEPSLDIQPLGDGQVIEGDSGNRTVDFLVRRSGTNTDVSVNLTLGGAIDSNDATLSTTSLSFVAGGVESQVVSVMVNGDETLEGDEVFAVELFEPVGANLSTLSQATGTILNDEGNLIVTTTIDEDDGALGVGAGDSLREVLGFANSDEAIDVIGFSPSLLASGAITVSLDPSSVPLLITQDVRIFGSDSVQVTIQGSGTASVFVVDDQNSNSMLQAHLEDLTLTNASGEAIFNRESLVLVDSTIQGNLNAPVGSDPSRGIANFGAAELIRSRILDHQASGIGGGVYNAGTLTIDSSTIDGNRSNGAGGGIFNTGAGTLDIVASTVSGNTAIGSEADTSTNSGGGGIHNAFGGTLAIESSTISSNHTNFGNGSGILNSGGATVVSSTITANTSEVVGRTGVFNLGTMLIDSTIVAGNLSGTASAPSTQPGDLNDLVDPASSNNLIGDPNSSGGLIDGTNGNIVGDGFGAPLDIATVLGPLANNGGPTFTHALLPGSPAIDVGSSIESFDQRGAPFVRDDGGGVDIGAYEFVGSAPQVTSIVIDDGTAQASVVRSITVNFDSDIIFDEGAFDLKDDEGNTIDVTTNVAPDTVTNQVVLTFSGDGVDASGSLENADYALTVLSTKIRNSEGVYLDGNNNGSMGGDAVDTFYRLFGDFDGNEQTDFFDFFDGFLPAFETLSGDDNYNAAVDFNGDGLIAFDDFFDGFLPNFETVR